MAAEKWLFPLFSFSFVSLLLFISGFTVFFDTLPSPSYVRRGAAQPPAFAYFISGGRGDTHRILRLLLAVYHPRNCYLLHLSADAPAWERADLATSIRLSIPAIRAFGNVHVVRKPDAMSYMGSSVLAATLHAAAVLLRLDGGWDWFVTLSAADYPLVTPDDLIHVFPSVPRDLNFIDHTSDLGWKEYQRVQPIIVDAGIYLSGRNNFFEASQKRPTPDAFKFFTGSPWVILSRRFMKYCVLGWDNLPRTLLMYFTNVKLPLEGYFHSVICSSPDYQNTTVNSDLRYVVWKNPPQMEPRLLNMTDYAKMVESGVPFARKFSKDDPVLEEIDDKIFRRRRHRSVAGAWCTSRNRWWVDPCSQWSNVNIVKPRSQARRFGRLMKRYSDEPMLQLSSCE